MAEEKMATIEQYRAVLDDLLLQRNHYQFRITEIESGIAALRRLMPHEQSQVAKPRQEPLLNVAEGKYAGMSVRWGILELLTEDATGPMTTGQIADALRAGGTKSDGKNFASNVSAILSDMNRVRGEVESGPEGFTITASGRNAWIHIKPSRDAKRANSPSSPNAPVQQFVQ